MYTYFTFKIPIGIFALNKYGGTFNSGNIAVKIIKGGHLVAVSFTPAVIHSEKHFRPVLRLCSACACVEGKQSVFAVILAVKQG